MWLKRQHRLGDEAAEVKCLAAGPGRYVVNPRKLQQILRQSSHPRGHGEDVPGEPLPRGGVGGVLAQELGVAEYDGKRRLELMRGVSHKLPLLLPGQLHGPDSPARQKETDGQKGRKAQHAYEQAVPDEAAYHVPLAGHVGKDDIFLSVNRDTAVAQAVVFQDAGDITPGGLRGQRGKKIFVCQVVVSAFSRDNGALIVQFQNKVGQAHAFRRLSRTPGTQRVRGYALHHAKAFALQVRFGEEQHKREYAAEQERHDGHVDADELYPQPPYQSPRTSRW